MKHLNVCLTQTHTHRLYVNWFVKTQGNLLLMCQTGSSHVSSDLPERKFWLLKRNESWDFSKIKKLLMSTRLLVDTPAVSIWSSWGCAWIIALINFSLSQLRMKVGMFLHITLKSFFWGSTLKFQYLENSQSFKCVRVNMNVEHQQCSSS